MKRFLRNCLAKRALCVFTLSVLSGAQSLVRAQSSTFDGCGTLIRGYICPVLFASDGGAIYDLGHYGGFNVGDYVQVVGTLDYSPRPCYMSSAGIVNNTISSCNTTWYINPDGSGDAPTIQAGLDWANPGDTLVLTSGTFTGVGNRDINFRGKPMIVTSQGGTDVTIIDCEDLGRGFLFRNGEDSTSVLSGVTIQNARGTSLDMGGGIYCSNSSPTIQGNVLRNNSSGYSSGGGILNHGGSPVIRLNVLENNWSVDGGAICSERGAPLIRDNTIADNYAESFGGGICCYGAATIFGNTVTNNIFTALQANSSRPS